MRRATLALLITFICSLAYLPRTGLVCASDGAIYIRSDGSVEGTAYIESGDNITYVFTADIDEPIIVQRSNIIVDGNCHVLNGSGLVGVTGLHVDNAFNVTIRNVDIVGFGSGVVLSQSRKITVTENTIRNCSLGVVVHSTSQENVIVGNRITDTQAGVTLGMGASNNTISRNIIENEGTYGLRLSGFTNTVVGNNISSRSKHGDYAGLFLEDFIGGKVVGNRVEDSRVGIWVGDWAESNDVAGNTVLSNFYGVYLTNRSIYNVVRGNYVVQAEEYALVSHASYNFVYHNNIIAGANRSVLVVEGVNFWDNGFEGNYWSDLASADLDRDGILDDAYVVNANNVDRFPLAGLFSEFNATSTSYVQVVCNSSISNFHFNGSAIRFYVAGEDGALGFCRVCIPKTLVGEPYQVLVNGSEPDYVDYMVFDNGSHRWIYFEYVLSTREVVVVAEFKLPQILLCFMVATLLAVIVRGRKRIGYAGC
ncbi:right-handed parallel beta-helix repeat-containing protein [Candidatus Bathyarchaeota archaeon]|nr:right-handed parallel beta-helix repeat-containing protein [Candidatus Bathyarchaeota archaeon]